MKYATLSAVFSMLFFGSLWAGAWLLSVFPHGSTYGFAAWVTALAPPIAFCFFAIGFGIAAGEALMKEKQ